MEVPRGYQPSGHILRPHKRQQVHLQPSDGKRGPLMTSLLIAVETAENIAELIEEHSLSSHMKSIAHEMKRLVDEAGYLGYIEMIPRRTFSAVCLCGCGKLVISSRKGRRRDYYSDVCRQRAHRAREKKRFGWTQEEENTLVEAYNTYHGNQHWVHGQKGMVWSSLSSELGRTVSAVRAKYEQLRRKGRVK